MDQLIGRSYTLMSNASLKYYPSNTASRFTVQLPSHLTFDDEWVVGLSEIHFPLSFEEGEEDTDQYAKKPVYSNSAENGLSSASKKTTSYGTEYSINKGGSEFTIIVPAIAEDSNFQGPEYVTTQQRGDIPSEGEPPNKRKRRAVPTVDVHLIEHPIDQVKVNPVVEEEEPVLEIEEEEELQIEQEKRVKPKERDPRVFETTIGLEEDEVQPECRKIAQEYEHELRDADISCEKVIKQKVQKIHACKAEKQAEIEKAEIRNQELLSKHELVIESLKRELTAKHEGEVQRFKRELTLKDQELGVKQTELRDKSSAVNFWKNNFVSLAHLTYKDANQMNNTGIPKYLQIYCDIVQMRMVGDTFGNYLHTVRVPPIRINGETGVEKFDFPRYVQLSQYNFDRIGFAIRDEFGRLVRFKKGTLTLITLHFKRVR